MNQSELPPDLRDLEALLKARHHAADDANVRSRILGRVKQELAQQKAPRVAGAWRFVAGFAAAFFLGANLSMSAVNNMDWKPVTTSAPQNIQAVEEQIRNALPELSESDVRQRARLIVYASEARWD